MKKLVLLNVMLTVLMAAGAQNDSVVGYRSIFGRESTEWRGATQALDASGWENWILRTSYDTIICGLFYKKIECYSYRISVDEEHRYEYCDFFLREDTVSGKLWIRYPHDIEFHHSADTDYLIMDMNLEIGDSIFLIETGSSLELWSEWFYVANITYSDSMKIIHLESCEKYADRIDFIEGVGCSNLFDFVLTYQVQSMLLCCHKDGELIYHNDEDCLKPEGAGIGNCNDNDSISAYPNPCQDFIVITGKDNLAAKIYDTGGKMIRNVVNIQSPVFIGDLPAGIYCIKIISNLEVVSKTIIKQ